ncbi:carbohydrate ABC transporter substrate-binding protein, CUT1 family [Pseudonocardia thermophila]|uniref:Carbohydrate ABC transporter substrate-binding protein, CUT1 family n=1 Tax=Pseudonocardia thermophila TaxID=1848 RepID=A0A1M6Q6T3_PSETH|nr:extracellular solute-binding protein [Pseudonocardia thermophila]SHK15840.1 carbohydrate ABC transporter substrate-binding protein, CUT1 family [Pseudonocardia thermophila]
MPRPRWTLPLRRRGPAVLAAVVLLGTLAGCGGGQSGPPVLTWYINPDSGGQKEIAERCTAAAGGEYRIAISVLPREASEQRQQLVRRLAAGDDSIDLMSLDPPYIPEFSQAGFLAPVPDDVARRVTDGVAASAVEGATWNGKLVAVPFWANTQLLWYKKSVAERAGLDMSQPVTWDQLIEAAKSQNTTIAVQGRRAESLVVWLNALIESAGGAVITGNADKPQEIQLGLDSPQSQRASEVMAEVATSGVAGPAFTTSGEDQNAAAFESGAASFMVNWPFVWSRAESGVEDGTLDKAVIDDFGWALYPRVDADKPAAPPYGGINLGISSTSNHPDLAYKAAECIVSADNQKYYFVSNGNPASKLSVYTDPEVLADFPMAPVIAQSLQLAKPRPQTAYYSEVSGSLQRVYHPPTDVNSGTGPAAAELIRSVLAGEELL